MPQTVEEVVGERTGEDYLAGVLENIRDARYQFDDVYGGKGLRRDEVSKGESVEYCGKESGRL